jgi:nitrate reductase / nitrite oxidoreductase, alpha subunit
MHSFIHPLSAAVPPCWESKSDWQIFKAIAEKFSELAAKHFPEPVRDVVASPLAHDTPAEIAQPEIKDWITGEVEAIPGQDHARLKSSSATTRTSTTSSSRSARWPARTASARTARTTQIADEYDEMLLRDRPAR